MKFKVGDYIRTLNPGNNIFNGQIIEINDDVYYVKWDDFGELDHSLDWLEQYYTLDKTRNTELWKALNE